LAGSGARSLGNAIDLVTQSLQFRFRFHQDAPIPAQALASGFFAGFFMSQGTRSFCLFFVSHEEPALMPSFARVSERSPAQPLSKLAVTHAAAPDDR